MAYWLMKSEPISYSIDALQRDRTTSWEGVRNYQARNFLRQMMLGDIVFFYHSNAEAIGIVGIAKIVKPAYPDPSQFDLSSKYYDEKAKKEEPRWFLVDIEFIEKFRNSISLATLKAHPALSGLEVCRKGSRLSVHSVADEHAQVVLSLVQTT